MSIAESRREKVGAIFNGNQFLVPSYQRKYSWSNKERKELWDDIQEARKNNINHFFGTLIFKKVENENLDEVYEIIDGQQRTTSLFILLHTLISKITDSDKKNKYFEKLIYSDKSLRVSLQGNDNNYLYQLFKNYAELDRKQEISKRSHRNLFDARIFFENILSNNSEQDVLETINFILQKIEVLVLVVEKQSEAIRMFEIINDRGLELSYLDKVKSILMLYSTMYLNSSLNDTINCKFEMIYDANDDIVLKSNELKILNRFDENETLFTHHYIKAQKYFPDTWNYRNGSRTIFETIKNRCEKLKNTHEELKSFIEEYVKDFASFSKSYSDLIKTIETKHSYIEAFQLLEFSATLYPLVVLLFQQEKLDNALDILISIELRVYKFKGTNPRADIPNLCNQLSEKEVDSLSINDWLKWFRDKFMNEIDFKYYLDDSIYGNSAVKFLLYKYNNSLEANNIDSFGLFAELQVEHIFPQGGENGVQFDVKEFSFKNDEDYNYKIDKLGNLTLLEKELNASQDVSNLLPKQKVNGYLKSNIKDVNSMAGFIDKYGFNEKELEARNDKIIEFILKYFWHSYFYKKDEKIKLSQKTKSR